MFDSLIRNLETRGYHAVCFDTLDAATAYIDSEIDQTTVGIGGSLTVKELKLDELLSTQNTLYWHWLKDRAAAEQRKLAMQTEVYISSVNGIAETGEIVNIDASGNRLASLNYGHKPLYLIVGSNKIRPTMEDAIWRARNVAAPLNAQRLGRKTPCAVHADKCYDCNSPERICRSLDIMWRPNNGMTVTVVLINESLGA